MQETAAKEAKEQPVQQPTTQQPPRDPKAEAWAEKNEWFGKDNAMTYTAFDLHRKLTEEEGMEGARDLAQQMQDDGKGKVLDQFANQDNPNVHYIRTGPEIWRDTNGEITHFVSSMGTTGTIMGVSRYLKEQNPGIQIIGLQPKDGSRIPGIRRWPKEYLPKIFDRSRVDEVLDVDQQDAEETMRVLAIEEGIFCGVSSGGSVYAALELSKQVENATIVAIICDRGDRYLSTGVFSSA